MKNTQRRKRPFFFMKGEQMFVGYYKNPGKTAEAFDHDGWFMTGDVV